jgi:hypothetical protein
MFKLAQALLIAAGIALVGAHSCDIDSTVIKSIEHTIMGPACACPPDLAKKNVAPELTKKNSSQKKSDAGGGTSHHHKSIPSHHHKSIPSHHHHSHAKIPHAHAPIHLTGPPGCC